MRDNSFKPTNEEVNLLNYLNNLNGTIEWIQYSQKYGRLEHYYKPYIHYAYDLQRECQTKMILLNTSYDEWIYKQLMSRYTYETPNPQYFKNTFQSPTRIVYYSITTITTYPKVKIPLPIRKGINLVESMGKRYMKCLKEL